MRKPVLLALVALALARCKNEPPPVLAAPSVAKPAPPAAEPAAPEVAERLELTAGRLDSFLEYQQKMLEVFAQAISDVKAMDKKTTGGLAAADHAVNSIKRKEKAEKAARTSAGLSERDLERLEELVGEILAKRQVGRTMNFEATLEQIEKLRAAMPKDQQAGLEPSIAELRKQHKELESLKEEREKYGSANVDLVLSREAELSRNNEKLMELWSGKP